ncbi:MAG: hypothetical protein AABX47_01875 [Nanoarchaeota archaeon]
MDNRSSPTARNILFVIHPTASYDVSRSAEQGIRHLASSPDFHEVKIVDSKQGDPGHRYLSDGPDYLSDNGSIPKKKIHLPQQPVTITVAGGFFNQCFENGAKSILRACPNLEELVFPLEGIYLDALAIGRDHFYMGIPLNPSVLRKRVPRPRLGEADYTVTLMTLLQAALDPTAAENELRNHVNKYYNLPYPVESFFTARHGQRCLAHRPSRELEEGYHSTMGY